MWGSFRDWKISEGNQRHFRITSDELWHYGKSKGLSHVPKYKTSQVKQPLLVVHKKEKLAAWSKVSIGLFNLVKKKKKENQTCFDIFLKANRISFPDLDVCCQIFYMSHHLFFNAFISVILIRVFWICFKHFCHWISLAPWFNLSETHLCAEYDMNSVHYFNHHNKNKQVLG